MNPYTGTNFFSFILTFFTRIPEMLKGNIATDEVQILTLTCISISSALIGTFLVLRRMTMLANSLSHTILLGIVLAFLLTRRLDLSTIVIASLFTALVTTLLTQLFTRLLRLQEDASIGLVFISLFALGVVIVSLYTRSAHIGLEAIMGNVDALTQADLQMSALFALVNAAFIFILFRPLLISTFDPTLTKTFGLILTYILMFQTSALAIAAFRSVGVFLFLSLLVGPVIIARFFTHTLSKMLFLAPLIGTCCSFFAVALSRHCFSLYRAPLSTSGLLVTLIALLTLASGLYRRRKSGNMEHSYGN